VNVPQPPGALLDVGLQELDARPETLMTRINVLEHAFDEPARRGAGDLLPHTGVQIAGERLIAADKTAFNHRCHESNVVP